MLYIKSIQVYQILQMLGQINKTMTRQFTICKNAFTKNENYKPQEISFMLAQTEASLRNQFKMILQTFDERFLQSKKELKKKNKTLNQLKIHSEEREFQFLKEVEQLKTQLQKNRSKVKQLLKVSQKYSVIDQKKTQKPYEEKGIQCQLKDQALENILEDSKKQNILLNEKIIFLEQKIQENQQNLDSANVLIKELIKQLETNISDRQTWNGTGSSNASQTDSLSCQDQTDQQQFSDQSQQMSQRPIDCQANQTGEDNSTIDGSDTTKKDFALPEWLQFDQIKPDPHTQDLESLFEQQKKMWPELLWNRMRSLIGLSYEI